MTPFSRSWTALPAAVAGPADADFARHFGCRGRLVRDLVCHRALAERLPFVLG